LMPEFALMHNYFIRSICRDSRGKQSYSFDEILLYEIVVG